MNELIEKIEEYGFECEAGRLTLCVDWIELKEMINGSCSR